MLALYRLSLSPGPLVIAMRRVSDFSVSQPKRRVLENVGSGSAKPI